jgi:hypothetical protein
MPPRAPPAAEVLALAAKHLLERDRLDLAREVAAAALAEDDACASAHTVMDVVCDALGEFPTSPLRPPSGPRQQCHRADFIGSGLPRSIPE